MKLGINKTLIFAAMASSLLLVEGLASAQVASALLREGDTVDSTTVTSLNNTAQNGVGGFAFTLTSDDGTNLISRVWGNATGGAGAVIRSEGTFGPLEQTSFESFFGISDAGDVSYSPSSNNTTTGATSLDGAWKSDQVILIEGDPISDLLGQWSTFNSRPGITRDGEPYWVGGYSDTQGGSTQNRALFFREGANILLKGGDSVVGIAEPLITGSAIDFDARLSATGVNYITPVLLSNFDAAIVSNGVGMTADDGVIKEGEAVSANIGGLVGEQWSNFDFVGITDAGNFFVTGDTNAATTLDEFVLVDEMIVLREGDTIGTDTISGAIEGGFMNEDVDWSVIWDANDDTGANVEVLILNGEIVLREGDTVDWNGDGLIDASDDGAFITDFTGTTSLTMSDRDADGKVNVMFTADCDVNGTVIEGGFSLVIDLDGGGVVELSPTTFEVVSGEYVSGGLAELAESDNADLSARRSTADVQSRVFVEFKATSPTETPIQFDFRFEAAVFARSTVTQSLDLFNYDTDDWEEVDVRDANRITDITVDVVGTGDLSRFVQPGTGCIEARVRFQSAVARQRFTALTDQVLWTIE